MVFLPGQCAKWSALLERPAAVPHRRQHQPPETAEGSRLRQWATGNRDGALLQAEGRHPPEERKAPAQPSGPRRLQVPPAVHRASRPQGRGSHWSQTAPGRPPASPGRPTSPGILKPSAPVSEPTWVAPSARMLPAGRPRGAAARTAPASPHPPGASHGPRLGPACPPCSQGGSRTNTASRRRPWRAPSTARMGAEPNVLALEENQPDPEAHRRPAEVKDSGEGEDGVPQRGGALRQSYILQYLY